MQAQFKDRQRREIRHYSLF